MVKSVLELTDDKEVDLVFDPVGLVNLSLRAYTGRWVCGKRRKSRKGSYE